MKSIFDQKRPRVPSGWILLYEALEQICVRLYGDEWTAHDHHGSVPYRVHRRTSLEEGRLWQRRFYVLEPQGTEYRRRTISKGMPVPAGRKPDKARRFCKMADSGGELLLKMLSERHLTVHLRASSGELVKSGIPEGIWHARWRTIFETGHLPMEGEGKRRYMTILIEASKFEKALNGLGVDVPRVHRKSPVGPNEIAAIRQAAAGLNSDFSSAGVSASREEWQDIAKLLARQVCQVALTVAAFKAEVWPFIKKQGWSMVLGKKANSDERRARVVAIRDAHLRNLRAASRGL